MSHSFTKAMAILTAVAMTQLPATPAFENGATATPIQHLVIIFQENVSFDHYFGTYPNALNPPGEPAFHGKPGTPAVNGLTAGLLTNNPNLNPLNGAGATNPFRLDRSQAVTTDQSPCYKSEQQESGNGFTAL